eukprot:Hpha_TRINITY_DN9560_c0_g1::TRINITY_DN9560_c0_g1_i1::g.114733::m.114733/K17914/KIF13; kinesin family member 13
MLGGDTGDSVGLIPRVCEAIFSAAGTCSFDIKVEVCYVEIYQEQVRCLLNPLRKQLRVREHPSLGPYVEGATHLVVNSAEAALKLLEEGGRVRRVAETNMNQQSSRSHAIFTIRLTQLHDVGGGVTKEKVSRLNLVDLAGSERARSTKATGERLAEGAHINRSLTTLGLVICSLAEKGKAGKRGRKGHVPYRDSLLTWLLKDNLGGNSRTTMLCTVSPIASSRDESVSSLRYADRAKSIVSNVRVNEDQTVVLIRQLREEISRYQEKISAYEAGQHTEDPRGSPVTPTGPDEAEVLRERLAEAEELMREAGASWAERLERSREEERERGKALAALGLTVRRDPTRPCVVNLLPDEDNWLVCYLNPLQDLPLSASEGGLLFDSPEGDQVSCVLTAEQPHGAVLGVLPGMPAPVAVVTGGKPRRLAPGDTVRLQHGDELGVGAHHMRFSDPRAPPEVRELVRKRSVLGNLEEQRDSMGSQLSTEASHDAEQRDSMGSQLSTEASHDAE